MNVADTAAGAIEALGGTGAVAADLDVGMSAVRNWRRNNAFPPRLYLPITDLAQRRGVEVDRSLFRELSGEERP